MSTLAAIGAWQAVSAQMKDSQKRELENYQNQKVLERQSFETTFFNMLSFFGDMVSTIELPESFGDTILRAVHSPSMSSKNPITGKKAFEDIAADLIRNITSSESASPVEIWNDIYSYRKNELGHYFRVLYNIFLFIDESSVQEKWKYSRFVRAQLSNSELILLSYNCCFGYGIEKFKPILEKYSLLDNLDLNRIDDEKLMEPIKSKLHDRAFSSKLARESDPHLFRN